MIEKPNEFTFEDFPAGSVYELRIKERLARPTLAWFEDMKVMVDETTSPPNTIISGSLRDQAALFGLINRIRDLGLTLLSVQQVKHEEK